MKMKKNLYFGIVLIAVLIICIYIYFLQYINMNNGNEKTITLIQIESVKGIAVNEAENLCYEKIGRTEKETGFKLIYIPHTAIEVDNRQYYVFRWQWLVNNLNYSTITYLAVRSDGTEIREAIERSDGTYSLGDIRWNK